MSYLYISIVLCLAFLSASIVFSVKKDKFCEGLPTKAVQRKATESSTQRKSMPTTKPR